MAEYDIDRSAATEAGELLRDLLRTEVPTGDFTEGSANSDILIDGHAIITGFLRQQINLIRDRQSLLTLKNLPESESVSDAADAILSNFFRTRAQGKFAKGVATLRFSQRLDVLIPRAARFFRTTSLVFYIDSASDLFISAADLRPDLDGNGLVTSYSTTVFMTAARVGGDYNITPGRFVSYDRFNAYLVSVENLARFQDGAGVQSTADFVSRSTNAISLRALINDRSNDVTLLEQFSDIESTTTVGYGDPEMIRDLVTNVANSAALHVGGHMDVFVRQPIQQVVERLTINTLTPRNDDRVLILRHTTTTPSGSFITAGVAPGDILRIESGVPDAPFQFTIVAVRATELEIAPRTPFSVATDELTTPTPVAYTVGNNYPSFNNKVSVVATLDASTSRQFSEFNRIQLPGRPTYLISRVELVPPFPIALNGYADSLTGNVVFTTRKNAPTLAAPPIGSDLSFYVQAKNPAESQSDRSVMMLEVGWPAVDLTGCTLEVTYETPSGFDAVSSYVSNRFNRPACANTLTRAAHPVYVYASIPYRQRATSGDPLSTAVPTFDPDAAADLLQTYVNSYRDLEPLDVSLLATKARETSAAIASILTFKVQYWLYLPDGRYMAFETDDKITIYPDEVTSSAKLLNPGDFGLPTTGYGAKLRQLLTDQGLSDRVTRYRVTDGGLVFERRA
jgi:hypothetical protein